MIHRREFIKRAAIGSALMLPGLDALAETFNYASLNKLGVNLFSIPKLAETDFAGTMKMLSQIGYKGIEFYGPYSFSAEDDKTRWAAVAPALGFSASGYYGMTPKETRKILDDNGLSSPSMHTGLATLQSEKAMDAMAEAAHVMGTTYVVLPSAATQPDLDSYKKQADDFNKIGEAASKRGIRFAYHNHGNGLKAIDGVVPFELLMEKTDPKHVYYQMDLYWVTAGGIDAAAYLDKYKGRFRLMHVKDMSKAVRFSGDGGDSKQWMELFPYLANAGSGVLDLPNILAHAKTSGVEHFIVERDLAPEPKADLQQSYSYLSKLDLK
jgi:sugar phosphate isomerase/epimerase